MRTDLSVFTSITHTNLVITVILGLILSKVFSGFMAGNLTKFSTKESLLIGFSTIPQLSTTLAVSFTALEIGILNEEVVTSLVILSIVTTFVAPFAIKRLSSEN
jgi:Kef-type K+ transport system membrane component KefB